MDRWLKTGSLKRENLEVNSDEESEIKVKPNSAVEPTPKKKLKIAVTLDEDPGACSAANKKIRKYNDEFLSLGFTYTGAENEQKPQCIICYEVLSNECMKPSKLRRHLESKHPQYVTKSVDFFKIKLRELCCNKEIIEKTATGTNSEKAVSVSYQISLLIGKTGKPHTIGEELILPSAKTITSVMFGEKAAKELNLISLSNNTVKRRIDEMAENIKQQLVERVHKSQYYSLQLDESTDISDNANLLCFIRYEFNGKVVEDLLFCQSLATNTTACALFDMLNEFIIKNELNWSKCVAVTTDGARAMSGKYTGLVARIRQVAPSIKWIHCCIHREALAIKKMPENLKSTLDEVVKVVNWIKTRPLQSRIFSALCEEMGSEHIHLLKHAEVRWLSRGKVLNRMFELRDDIRLFFNESQFHLAERFNDFSWLAKVAYLADIFGSLNSLNLSLQGEAVTIFKVEDKVEGMIKKLKLWSTRLIKKVYDSFPTLNDFLAESDEVMSDEIRNILIQHLEGLAVCFRGYFPIPNSDNIWIRDPFNIDVSTTKGLTSMEEDNLVELSSDSALKLTFQQLKLEEFWLLVRSDYKMLSDKAMQHLMPFPTSYMCEQTFSQLVYIKNKYRNKVEVEPNLRVKVSPINPDITKLISKKQIHRSH